MITHQEPATNMTATYPPFGLTAVEAELLIRFSAEFLSRSKWTIATPQELEAAYRRTVPYNDGAEELHVGLQDLGDRVRPTLGENLWTWICRQRSSPIRRQARPREGDR